MKLNFPPIILLLCLLLQFLLIGVAPIAIDLSVLIGLLMISFSIFLIIYSFIELKNHETTYIPDGEPEHLVTSGPFAYSRNPIYLGMLGILISVGLFSQSLSSFLIPALFIFIIENTWIKHEEKKLKTMFEKEWNNYASKTRKWL